MKFALHGMITKHSNIMSDISIASLSGYEGIEVHTDKLWRFIHAGGTSTSVQHRLQTKNIQATTIDIIGGIETTAQLNWKEVEYQTRTLSKFAQDIGATTIQLNAFEGLNSLHIEDIIYLTAKNIKKIVRIGSEYGIRFQYEGAAWTPIHSLQDCLALVEEVGEKNFGLVIDFWHFWASRGAEPSEISKLDKNIIFGVHCCGGERPKQNKDGNIVWVDETELRGYFPEDKEGTKELLPVKEWVDAVCATSYDGWVSGEFLNQSLWENDNIENAINMKKKLEQLFNT